MRGQMNFGSANVCQISEICGPMGGSGARGGKVSGRGGGPFELLNL